MFKNLAEQTSWFLNCNDNELLKLVKLYEEDCGNFKEFLKRKCVSDRDIFYLNALLKVKDKTVTSVSKETGKSISCVSGSLKYLARRYERYLARIKDNPDSLYNYDLEERTLLALLRAGISTRKQVIQRIQQKDRSSDDERLLCVRGIGLATESKIVEVLKL